MSTLPESALDPRRIAPAVALAARQVYWSVRRELWEDRFIFIAPLTVAAIVLAGFVLSTSYSITEVLKLPPALRQDIIEKPYDLAAFAMMVTGFFVAAFYCLDALHSERRDHSILFWKSLPVSDLATVLSKAAIPLVILPLVVFAITVTLQLTMLLFNWVMMLGDSRNIAALWNHMPLLGKSLWFLYGLAAISPWYAPIYGWLMMISGWARRATLLWAVLPVIVVGVLDRLVSDTSHVQYFLQYRFFGWYAEAFDFKPHGGHLGLPVAVDPLKFLSTPGMWLGLAFAAGFFVAAARLRRYRGPL